MKLTDWGQNILHSTDDCYYGQEYTISLDNVLASNRRQAIV